MSNIFAEVDSSVADDFNDDEDFDTRLSNRKKNGPRNSATIESEQLSHNIEQIESLENREGIVKNEKGKGKKGKEKTKKKGSTQFYYLLSGVVVQGNNILTNEKITTNDFYKRMMTRKKRYDRVISDLLPWGFGMFGFLERPEIELPLMLHQDLVYVKERSGYSKQSNQGDSDNSEESDDEILEFSDQENEEIQPQLPTEFKTIKIEKSGSDEIEDVENLMDILKKKN